MTLSRIILTIGFALSASLATAQPRDGRTVFFPVEGLFSWQGDADLSGGGGFSVNRAYVRAGGFNRLEGGQSLGVFASFGASDYTFSGVAAPWGQINDAALTVSFGKQFDNGAALFVAPSMRAHYEAGASRSSGQTYGLFAGVTWDVSERLNIGPGFGAFTQVGTDENRFFPALLIDWKITDRLNLSTGPTIGASQGPGLTLGYALSDALSLNLTGRYEKNRFRLSANGPVPGGVGEDESFPLVVSVGYNPNPGVSVSGFIGAELEGVLRVEDSSGALVSSQSYGTVPIAGFAVRLAF